MRGEVPLLCRFAPPKTRDLAPSGYFPNSFRRDIPGNPPSPGPIGPGAPTQRSGSSERSPKRWDSHSEQTSSHLVVGGDLSALGIASLFTELLRKCVFSETRRKLGFRHRGVSETDTCGSKVWQKWSILGYDFTRRGLSKGRLRRPPFGPFRARRRGLRWTLGLGSGGPDCGWQKGTPCVIGWASLYWALVSVIVHPSKQLLALWVWWTCAEHVLVHVFVVVGRGAPGVFGRAGL
jgi:hypothetical protein